MQTVRELIDSLGGAPFVARRMDCTKQGVYKWIKDKKIPDATCYKVAHVFDLDPQDVLRLGRDAA